MNTHTSTSLLGAAVVLLYAGCGSRAGTTSTTHTLRTLSSISDGAALSSAAQWNGTEAGVPVQDVDRVEFVIDGRVRWTERQTPYVFNGNGNELSPDTFHQTATGSLRRPQLDVRGHLETHMNHEAQPTSTPTTGDRR